MKQINFLDTNKEFTQNFVFDKLKLGYVGLIGGLGSVGKSYFVLENLIRHFVIKYYKSYFCELDIKINCEKCLFITTEEDYEDVIFRIKNILKNLKIDTTKLENVELLEYLNNNFKIMVSNDKKEIDSMLQNTKDVELVILDTLSVIVDIKNENDNSELSKKIETYKNICRKNNYSILFIHHLSQNGMSVEQEKDINVSMIRGGTTLVNNLRYVSVLMNIENSIVFKNLKVNNGKLETIKFYKDFWENGFKEIKNVKY